MYFAQVGRDYQVNIQNLSLWKVSLSLCETRCFEIYESLNRIITTGSLVPDPTDYLGKESVSDALLMDLEKFIKM